MEIKKINQEQIKELLNRIIYLADISSQVSLSWEMNRIRQEYRVEHLFELTEDQFGELMSSYDDEYSDICAKHAGY